ncbi:phage tail protein [Andreprevotia chitinilytica]|uniref:phage tail protein n=1 Tax=Andreprevotia chitinilytica TaxID=396808 RepID=UPI000554BE93|nr:tail fiber protein [Andreprevotia chitinilytica]
MAQPYVGEIRIFAGTYAPTGWFFCDGTTYSIADYEVLYALLGTTYGGNGQTTFGVPNLTGKLPVGQGTGVGLTPRVMGQMMGTANVTLTTGQIPSHNHAIQGTTNAATTNAPDPTLTLGTVATAFYDSGATNPPGKNAFASNTLGTTGQSLPHSNEMPSMSINYIIAYSGIFPSQG